MDRDLEESGTRIFHQVTPSEWTGRRRFLKLVPGQSIQTHTPVRSPDQVTSILSPQPTAVSPNTTSRGASERPLTERNHSVSPRAQIQLPISGSAPIKTFLPSLPLNSTTTADIPEILTPATQPAQSKATSKQTVIVIPKSRVPGHYALTDVNVDTSSAEEGTIRTFSKIPPFPPKPSSPIQWVVEDPGRPSGRSSEPSAVSPVVVDDVLEVVAQREQRSKTQAENQPEFSVVMFDDKIFFQINKKEAKEGDVIDLCRDQVSKRGADDERRADEDAVKFVSYTPAQSASGAEGGACTRAAPAPGGSSLTLTGSAQASSHREGHAPRTQMSGPSPALCPVADHELKQMFGITSEVKIRLPRVLSYDAEVSPAVQVPPLDYTEPIEEDFLCPVDPFHSQDCPQVEGSASRVGRTRKRTRCPCCSPATLHRYHYVQKRRIKPGAKEAARRQLKLQPPPTTAPESAPETTPTTAPQLPRKQAKPQPAQATAAETVTTAVTSPPNTPQIPRKQNKLKPASVTTPQIPRKQAKPKPPQVTTPGATPQIPRKQNKPLPNPDTAPVTNTETTPQIPRKQNKHPPTPDTAPGNNTGTTPQIPRKQTKPKPPQVTTPGTTPQTPRKQNKHPPTPDTAPGNNTETTPQIPRKQAKPKPPQMSVPVIAPGTTPQIPQKQNKPPPVPDTAPVTNTETTPQIPRKQAKPKPPQVTTPETTPLIPRKQNKRPPMSTETDTAPFTNTETTPQIPRKQTKPKPSQVSIPVTTPGTTPQIPRKQNKHPATPDTAPVTNTETTPQIPRKQNKRPPTSDTAPVTNTETTPQIPRKQNKRPPTPDTAPVTNTETTPQIPRKQNKPPPIPDTAPATNTETTPQIPRKQNKRPPTPDTAPVTNTETTPQIPRKQPRLKPPKVTTPGTASVTSPGTTPQIHQDQATLQPVPVTPPVTTPQIPQKPPLTAPLMVPLTATLTTLTLSQGTGPESTPDRDSEEMQIHKEIEQLREALRLKEAALEKLQNNRNR